jgi:hypothetical protein
MTEGFEDIQIIGKPDPLRVKVGSRAYTRIFSFPLSSAPPQRWSELLVQEWIYRITKNPRPIWVNRSELVLDCPLDELALLVERVGADIQIVNRKYRKEVETTAARTDQENEQAVEEKRVDAASIKKIIDELVLPAR